MNLDFLAKPAVLATSVVMFVAATFYYVIDTPSRERPSNAAAVETRPMDVAGPDRKAASVTSLVSGLEARLTENPDDAKGWLLLAKSHDHLGDRQAAWAAYGRAKELGMSDNTFEIELAADMSQLFPNN